MALLLNLNSSSRKHQLTGFGLIGAGLLIIGYLALVRLSFSAQPRLDLTQFGSDGTEKSNTSFGQILGTNGQKEPDPGLDITSKQISSFGQILGLKSVHKTASSSVPVLPEFSVSIPKLRIENARVKTNVEGTVKDAYLPVLKKAVAHFKGTALPGELGNIFLFGHSMLPVLAHGQYESIFTNLPKLQKDDIIKIKYGQKELTYQIQQTGIVDPQDVFVLQQSQVEQKITLMTCIPPGFGEKRFVAIGKLVSGNYLGN